MKNKLGVSEGRISEAEKLIISAKMNIINGECTFNKEKFDSSFLLELNNFLFSDLYDDLGYRNSNYNGIIESYLMNISQFAKENKTEEMLNVLKQLFAFKPFKYGNTITLAAFIKILDSKYKLNIDDAKIIVDPVNIK